MTGLNTSLKRKKRITLSRFTRFSTLELIVKFIHPEVEWFKAFEYSSFNSTKVIILGQDPYHGDGQAEGLSFSVPKGTAIPPSLRNIYKELESNNVNFANPGHGNLVTWATQGVLLLNSVLTVERQSPAAHANKGWEFFTDHVISLLNEHKNNLVFITLGRLC